MAPLLRRGVWRNIKANLILEEVGVDALHHVVVDGGHTNAVLEHQFDKSRPVDENDFGLDAVGVFLSIFRERRSRDEDALPRSLAVQGSDELLNLRSANGRAVPPLRLNVDLVKTEFVLFDYAVHAAVT